MGVHFFPSKPLNPPPPPKGQLWVNTFIFDQIFKILVLYVSRAREVHTRKWMTTAQKGLRMTCIHPFVLHNWANFENHGFDPFLSH